MGAVALIVAASLLLMGQASGTKTVEANEFILKDSSGNVRAKLWMNMALARPELVLFDAKEKAMVNLNGGSGSVLGGEVSVFDSRGRERGLFSADDFGGHLSLLDLKGAPRTILAAGELSVSDGRGKSIR